MASSVGKGLVVSLIKTPIIVVDRRGDDLSVYNSNEDAESHLEAVDVKNNEYRAYDSQGQLLALEIFIKKKPIIFGLYKKKEELIRFRPVENEPLHDNELRSALYKYFRKIGVYDDSFILKNMDQLISMVVSFGQRNMNEI